MLSSLNISSSLFDVWTLERGKFIGLNTFFEKKIPDNSMRKFSETGYLLSLLLPLFHKRNVDILIVGLIGRCVLWGKQQLIYLLLEWLV